MLRSLAAAITLAITLSLFPAVSPPAAGQDAVTAPDAERGICVVLDGPSDPHRELLGELGGERQWTFFMQSDLEEKIDATRRWGLTWQSLEDRLFIEPASVESIHLTGNLADLVLAPSDPPPTSTAEILRVLRPGGVAYLGTRRIVKPAAEGVDSWSHPYHGPDNNTQSTDQLAVAPYLTQFMAEPMFSPMPEQTVAAGGRIFTACGHIAHKKNQNQQLNTLFCINAYNGSILWTRPLTEGFMLHRNTMVATPEVLYMADDKSCKIIDAASGKTLDEIVITHPKADGPVWKWMALVDDTLYCLVGGREISIHTQRSETPGMGHWPWGMWDGHDYADPETNFGFGRTFLAIDIKSKKVLWAHREEEFLDSRAVCMAEGRLYAYCPEKFLACFAADDGKPVWKNDDADLLAAIGPNQRAQHYLTGYSTQTYMKTGSGRLFFAGPQRTKLVVASAEDGRLLWNREPGNLQIVLRDDGFYAAGAQNTDTSYKFAYDGEVLDKFVHRRACTRVTGTLDSIFFRAEGGTIRIETATNTSKHIAPMRPPCQDGVIVSDGHLFWGPWMCGCQISAYGNIALAPAGDFDFQPGADDSRLTVADATDTLAPVDSSDANWPTYGGNTARSMASKVEIPTAVSLKWSHALPGFAFPTAPIAAGGFVFLANRNGRVHALNPKSGEVVWETFTAGPVYFPPTLSDDRLFVGSADGRVYALETATGKTLWTFQAAPANQRIAVYGKLISRWPVAGGVVVHDDTVYAAAGIAHYDGIHVYALDAASGKIKWYNDSSGVISKVTDGGISLQGNLYIQGGELRFLGGNAYEFARYDLATGKCLNQPYDQPDSRFHTAFYAYYPEYGKYVTLEHRLADGRELIYDASYEGSRHTVLSLMEPWPEGTPRPTKPASRWRWQRPRRGEGRPKAVWTDKSKRCYNSFAVGTKRLLVAGHPGLDDQKTSVLAAIDLNSGETVWRQDLPAPVVKAGTALDSSGRIFVTLTDGTLLCYGQN